MIKKILFSVTVTLLLFSCSTEKSTKPTPSPKGPVKKEVILVTEDSVFDSVIALPTLSVVDMYADWCGPCKRLAPVLKELASEYGDGIDYYKVNVDKNRRLAAKYRANSIPLVLFFKDGKVIDRMEGFSGRAPLEQKILKNK